MTVREKIHSRWRKPEGVAWPGAKIEAFEVLPRAWVSVPLAVSRSQGGGDRLTNLRKAINSNVGILEEE